MLASLRVDPVGAQTSEPFKPYIVLALDVSGSMTTSTGSGPPSCGGIDTRIDHAKCAISNITNAYGDIVLSLGRFRQFTTSQTNSDDCSNNFCLTCDWCGIDCDSVGNGGIGGNSPIGRSGDRFEVLVPLLDGNQSDIVEWSNNICSADCTSDPELYAAGYTPLAGTLNGSKLYYQGASTPGTDPNVGVIPYWTGPGDDPIRDDALSDTFVVSADTNLDGVADMVSQCRPYIVILLTDGAETCAPTSETNLAATSLLTTTVDGRIYRIETKPIGFGIGAGDAGIEGIARNGGGMIAARRALDISSNSTAGWNNLTVTIGGQAYRMRTTLAAAFDVHIVAGDVSATLDNLAAAVNDLQGTVTGVEGVDYGAGTTPHPTVAMTKTDADTVTAIARTGGVSGNAIAVAETLPNGAWAGATLAGGNDDPAGNQGYYATNEATLSNILANIIEDSLRFERCNGVDDDCDGQIDEDFKAPLSVPGLGDACTDGEFGACIDNGVYVCNASQLGITCNAVDNEPPPPQSNEICNFADDDCDNKIDEAPADCTNCQPFELCNGLDDDCDSICDEDVTRPCGTDVGDCTVGTENCLLGCDSTQDWGPCSGIGPEPELCNSEDDDCDGTVDGFTEDCTDMVPPPNPDMGICHPGQRTCPTDGSGWSMCIGEVVPDPLDPNDASCNGLDNDCDGPTDEGFVPSPCSSNCGVGSTECTPTGIVCNTTQIPEPETCNDFDDDCDGVVDEDITEPPQGEPCDEGGTLCVPGVYVCNASTNGMFECQGGTPPGPEICNCLDDNCNTVPDDGAMCGAGETCLTGPFCQCAAPCATTEFPCPLGKTCINDFCVVDPCYGKSCPPQSGEAYECCPLLSTTCTPGDCVQSCSITTCPSPTVCRPSDGECVFDDCRGFPERCADNELCVDGTCVGDPCFDVTCPGQGEYCLGGNCVSSCGGVNCPAGQRCVLGECQPDPCGGPCGQFEVCDEDTGECIDDPCLSTQCGQGEWCNPQTGECEQDPCLGVECPDPDEVCENGTCYDPADFQPDAGPSDGDYVAPGGGGGCAAGGGSTGIGALVVLLCAVMLRGRRKIIAPLAALALAPGVVMTSSGCSVEGYCLNCEDGDGGVDDDGGGNDDGNGDGDGGGPPPDACIDSGNEVCDGLDNDCNGMIDDGTLPMVGDACGTDTGPCVAGTRQCIDGEMVCDGEVAGVPEICDGIDNDCDGTDDNGDPGGGTLCGTDAGECVSGINHCVGGDIECVGDIGPTAEVCDGLDNDCDSDVDPMNIDEDIPTMGQCGPPNDNGECEFGTMTCVGGVFQCVGAVYPTLEQCDGNPDTVDHDCDNNPTNGFNLTNDVRNCGACGNSCLDDHTPSDHVASVFCQAGTCRISQCEDDYWNNDGLGPPAYANGCEYFCDTFSGPQEACNGDDDDCDGDVDPPGELIHPEVCVGPDCRDVCDIGPPLSPPTPCAGTFSECIAGSWTCDWPAGVNNPDGDTLTNPESDCDNFDDDCDGVADDTFEPQKGDACFDSGTGICQRTGTQVCNGTFDGLVCGNLSPPVSPTAETCNNLDDDCLGDIDEGFTGGGATSAAWVNIGGGVSIFAYEASRPDASDTTSGSVQTHVCSKPDALPWTNVTYPEALAACNSLGGGARLCTEAEWQRACQGLPARYVEEAPATTNHVFSMQAEDYHASAGGAGFTGNDAWGPMALPGYTGVTAMTTYSDSGSSDTGCCNGARLTYNLTFPASGTGPTDIPSYPAIFYVYIRGWGSSTSSDSVHVGLDGATQSTSDDMQDFPASWNWVQITDNNAGNRARVSVPSAGNHTLDVWMREDGLVIDKIVLSTNVNYAPSGVNAGLGPRAGCGWSYSTDCETYAGDTCNGDDFDTDGTAGDQDRVLPTESMTGCFTDWGAAGDIFDMSGNVKEFTDDRSAAVNPLRGGGSNNTALGISCTNDFTVVDNDFAFPNTGFRCCK